MNKRVALTLILFLATVVTCFGYWQTHPSDCSTIEKGQLSTFPFSTPTYQEVITDDARWEEFWRLHNPLQAKPQDIDFDRDMVIVVLSHGSSGLHLSVKRVGEESGGYHIFVERSNQGGLDAVFTPFDIVKCKHSVLPKKFLWIDAAR